MIYGLVAHEFTNRMIKINLSNIIYFSRLNCSRVTINKTIEVTNKVAIYYRLETLLSNC